METKHPQITKNITGYVGHTTEGNLGKYLLPRLMAMQGDDLLEFSGFGDCLLAPIYSSADVWKVLPFQTVSHRIDASSRCASVAGRRIAKDDIFLPAEGTCEDRAYLLHTCFRSGCDLLLLCEHLQNAFCMQWRILSFPPNLLAPFLFPTKSIRESHQNIIELKLQA